MAAFAAEDIMAYEMMSKNNKGGGDEGGGGGGGGGDGGDGGGSSNAALINNIIILSVLLIIAACIGYAIYVTLRPPPSGAGGECTFDSDCINKVCARMGAEGPLVCCPSGQSIMYAGFDYCTDLPAGTKCWDSDSCVGGQCADNCNGFCVGACTSCCGAGQPGDICEDNSDCANGACAYPSYGRGAPHYVCCPSGERHYYGTLYYCTGMPPGTGCPSDATCETGSNCIGGECHRRVPAGTPCTSDNDCSGYACGHMSNDSTSPTVCCPTLGDRIDPGDFCRYTVQPGNSCTSSWQCTQGYYCDNVCTATPPPPSQ